MEQWRQYPAAVVVAVVILAIVAAATVAVAANPDLAAWLEDHLMVGVGWWSLRFWW